MADPLQPLFSEAFVVPKVPPLPSHNETAEDVRIISKIKHTDRKKNPFKIDLPKRSFQHTLSITELAGAENLTSRPKKVGVVQGKALFIDDYMLAEASGVVRRLLPGKKLGVVLEPSSPPQDVPNTTGFSFYGNVIHNGSHFLMYLRRAGGIGLASSKDGLHWAKEEVMLRGLDVPEMEGFDGEMCVQYDPDAEAPGDRWIAGASCRDSELCMLNSEDGREWKFAGHKWGRATDTYPCVYREGRIFTVLLRRDFGMHGGWREIRGVQVLKGQAQSVRDLSNLTLRGQVQDARNPNNLMEVSEWYLDMYGKKEHKRRAMYSLTRTRYADLYLGVAQIYEFAYAQSDPPYTTDVMAPHLVTSRDGVTFDLGWVRRTPLIPRGAPGEFDHGVILTAADWVTHGGYHWLYYAGWNAQHEQKASTTAKIGLARWPQDRLVSITPETPGAGRGRILTRILSIPAKTTALSVDAECTGGDIGVSILEAAPSLKVCAIGSVCGFHQGTEAVAMVFESGYGWDMLHDRPLQLEFTLMGNASLFGFQFLPPATAE